MSIQNQKRLLVVDDDRIVRLVHRRSFISAGYHVDEAESGKEAIAMFADAKGNYDIILMDYNMPNMNGADTTKELRCLKTTMQRPIIVGITGHIDSDIKALCLEAGMDEVVSKPIIPTDLEALVRSLLRL